MIMLNGQRRWSVLMIAMTDDITHYYSLPLLQRIPNVFCQMRL